MTSERFAMQIIIIQIWTDFRYYYRYDVLNSFQIDCVAENELTARINMADAKFSFQEKGKILDIYIVQEISTSFS